MTGPWPFTRPILAALAMLVSGIPAAWASGADLDRETDAFLADRAQAVEVRREVRILFNRIPKFHPGLDRSAQELYLMDLVDRGLFDHRSDGDRCEDCLKMPNVGDGTLTFGTDDAGHDVTIARFDLDPAATWGDGAPILAEDFALGWRVKRLLSGEASTARFRSVAAEGDRRVVITLAGGFCGALPRPPRPVPSRIEGPIFAAHGRDAKDYLAHSRYTTDPTAPGLWSGPFRVSGQRVAPSDQLAQIDLVPNRHWWGATPSVAKIAIVVYSGAIDPKVHMENRIDIALEGNPPSYTVRDEVVRRTKGALRQIWFPTYRLNYVALDFKDPILADARVRRALWLGLNREILMRSLKNTIGVTTDSFQHPFNPDYSPAPTRVKPDPAAAMALLNEAGWKPGPDGVRVDAAGQRLSVTMGIGPNFSLVWDGWLQELQTQWRAIGVELRTLSSGATIRSFGPFQGSIAVFNSFILQDQPGVYFHSTATTDWTRDAGGFNYSNFADPDMDQAVEAFETASCQPERRRVLAQRINTLIIEKVPIIPLWFTSGSVLLPSALDVGEVVSADNRITASVERWRINRRSR